MSLMERHQVRRLPVVNDRGGVVGIISCADIALRIGPSVPDEAEKLFAAVSRPEVLASST
jgi:CBS domain-containing protein